MILRDGQVVAVNRVVAEPADHGVIVLLQAIHHLQVIPLQALTVEALTVEAGNTIYNATFAMTANNGNGIVIMNSNSNVARCEKCKEIIFSVPRMGIFHSCKELEGNI